MHQEPILQTRAIEVLSLRNHWDNHIFGLERFVSYKEKERIRDGERCTWQPNCITIWWLHLNSILQTLQRKRPCLALAKFIHSIYYTLIFFDVAWIVCHFGQLGSKMSQKSVESIRNQLETTGHDAHVPWRVNLSVNTMECSSIPLFLSMQRYGFVAVARAGGRIFKKSHFRPRHKHRHKRHLNCHCWETVRRLRERST